MEAENEKKQDCVWGRKVEKKQARGNADGENEETQTRAVGNTKHGYVLGQGVETGSSIPQDHLDEKHEGKTGTKIWVRKKNPKGGTTLLQWGG